MRVQDAMSRVVLVIGPDHTIADAARLMTSRNIGAAIVHDDTTPVPGILTERDIMRAVGDGRDPATTRIADYMTYEARTASLSWDLDTAAREMLRGNFRHLVVLDDQGTMVGVVSMRDVVRARVGSPVGQP